jgi:hypothetical protein
MGGWDNGSLSRRAVAFTAGALGLAAWLAGGGLGPGPTPIEAGWRYLVIMGVAGAVLALAERNVSGTGWIGLYAGQVMAFGAQALLGHGPGGDARPWVPLFLLSFMLAAAVGGVLGAAAARVWWPSKETVSLGEAAP